LPDHNIKPDIPLLYEDNHILVINKPVNLLSQADHTGDPDLLTLCKEYLKIKYKKSGNVFLGLVHRLDRPVGGVMVLAKTSKAASRLSEQIRTRMFDKRYLLVVHGETPPNGVFVHHLLKEKNSNRVTVAAANDKRSKRAELVYQRLEYYENHNLSLVKVNLITGRAHQIRVQFSSEGFPLAGDRKYGKVDVRNTTSEPALFAFEIIFSHPTLKKTVSYKASPPSSPPWSFFKDHVLSMQ
jgi:23S rRNA pseudouridine1911/1915/1917 synthase